MTSDDAGDRVNVIVAALLIAIFAIAVIENWPL